MSVLLTIGILAPETTVVEDDFTVDDIVSKTPTPQPQSILSLSGSHSRALSDGVDTTTVHGVFLEDPESVGVSTDEIAVMLMQTTHKPLKMWSGANRKG